MHHTSDDHITFWVRDVRMGNWGKWDSNPACSRAYEIECQIEGLGQCLFQTGNPADVQWGTWWRSLTVCCHTRAQSLFLKQPLVHVGGMRLIISRVGCLWHIFIHYASASEFHLLLTALYRQVYTFVYLVALNLISDRKNLSTRLANNPLCTNFLKGISRAVRPPRAKQ
jgi:hypothetical protein